MAKPSAQAEDVEAAKELHSYNIPDDSNVLPFIANAAAIFRNTYKDPNGKKTAALKKWVLQRY